MIYLFIDTTKDNEIRAALVVDDKLFSIVEKIKYEYSEKLITVIDKIASELNINIGDINKIFVIEGPGRFSALRTGISTANTLAWQLNIPIVSLPAVGNSLNYWEEVLNKIKSTKEDAERFINYIVPKYGKEPNITLKMGD